MGEQSTEESLGLARQVRERRAPGRTFEQAARSVLDSLHKEGE